MFLSGRRTDMKGGRCMTVGLSYRVKCPYLAAGLLCRERYEISLSGSQGAV